MGKRCHFSKGKVPFCVEKLNPEGKKVMFCEGKVLFSEEKVAFCEEKVTLVRKKSLFVKKTSHL